MTQTQLLVLPGIDAGQGRELIASEPASNSGGPGPLGQTAADRSEGSVTRSMAAGVDELLERGGVREHEHRLARVTLEDPAGAVGDRFAAPGAGQRAMLRLHRSYCARTRRRRRPVVCRVHPASGTAMAVMSRVVLGNAIVGILGVPSRL
ncbi:hypothetical protein ACFW9I_33890 [[Kitasatospora] papulosa]|uniref:hypothetical protein n=1 Tax=[Kitasatospora] papulosa TaxID=1464011 RepID=UPI0036C58207